MTNNLVNQPKIWKGMDHRYFLLFVRDTLQQGSKHVSEGIPKREKWLEDNGHHLIGVQLVAYFAYLDGLLGSGWIEKIGKKQKRELYVLRTIRNALTHVNGRLSSLDKPKKSKPGKPKDPAGFVRRFCNDLKAGKIVDDKGTVVPSYMKVKNGKIVLNSVIYGRICGLFTALLVRAGEIA